MNIIVPHGFDPNYTLGFVKGLKANQIDVLVISSDLDERRLTACAIRHINYRGSVSGQRPVLVKLLNYLKYYGKLLGCLLRHRKSTVHFTGIFRNELLIMEVICLHVFLRLLSSRYIYTAHNVLPHNRENSGFFKWVYTLIYKIPDRILVTTPLSRQQLIEKFAVPADKIQIVSIGLNEEIPVTPIDRQTARQRLTISADDNLILFFGNIDPYKGLENLIAAFENFDMPCKLLIAGSFTDAGYEQIIRSLIDSSRRKDAIALYDRFIPNDEVELYFKSCDVLVLPYRNIYQSGLIFLAMRFGTPVVATNVGQLRDFVEDDMGIVTASNDVAGLRCALQQFFAQREKFSRAAICARGEKYRWDRICQSIKTLYQ